MIDWTTSIIPCAHSSNIFDGSVCKITAEGEIEWEVLTAKTVVGSYDSAVRVRTYRPRESLHISGNPAKFFQGHNLFGTDELLALNYAFFCNLSDKLSLSPSDSERLCWQTGDYSLSRVDCTSMLDVGSSANALAWIRQAEQQATLSHRGRGQITKGSTLYFGKHSRRWSAKFYAKGDEFQKNGHPCLLEDPKLVDYADRSVRFEVTLRSMELKRLGLDRAFFWSESAKIAQGVREDVLGRVNMGDINALTAEQIDGLAPSLRAVFELWKTGIDIRSMYPRRTFYHYRSKIKNELGIDIAVLQPSNKKASNVVPLIRVIEAVPMGVPDWALGTPLYFDPKKPIYGVK